MSNGLTGAVVDTSTPAAHVTTDPRPWSQLRDSGLLWLINRVAFHPRGYALALAYRDGEPVGWLLLGDGTVPWSMGGDETLEFAAANATLTSR